MYTQTEKVNIEPKSYLPVFRISQNDVGRTLKAHLVSDEGTIAIPAGATVTMAGIKPSGLGYTVTGTINGSDVTFETDAVMTDEAGQIESEIRIVNGETLIGTTNVVLNVEPNPHPDDTTDGQREPLVNEITALLNQITAQADRVEEYSSKVLNMTVSAHESQEPTVTKTEGEVVNLDFGLPRGEKGERGERGEQGEAGKDGKDGIDGKDGKDGINGVTPDFSIGTVTTLEPNESASVTLTGTEEEPILNFGIPRGEKGEQGDVSLSDLEKIMVTDTANGAIASFPDGSDLLPALSLVANIVPQQSGTGTPSPENIRPISGWESVSVTDAGKNVFDISGWINTFAEGQQVSFDDDTMTVGTTAGDLYFKPFRFSKTNTTITLSIASADVGSSVAPRFELFNESGSAVGSLTLSASGGTITRDAVAVRMNWSSNYGFSVTKPQIELGTTATAYEPYTGTTTTAPLGRTVYGGTLDVVSGVLTVTHGYLNYNGSENWQADSSRYTIGVSGSYREGYTRIPVTSNEGAFGTDSSVGTIFLSNTQLYYYPPTSVTSLADFKTWLASNNLQIVYPLATPQTYQLTPQTINTLFGVNNVWADSGDCSIVYYADTKLYIDKKLGGN